MAQAPVPQATLKLVERAALQTQANRFGYLRRRLAATIVSNASVIK